MAYELNVNLDAFDIPDELTIDDLPNVNYIYDDQMYSFSSLDDVCDSNGVHQYHRLILRSEEHHRSFDILFFKVLTNNRYVTSINTDSCLIWSRVTYI